MTKKHEVQQGEHLSRIAEQHGFGDYGPIWEHPENAGLRELRNDPHVLAPGDVVVIPDPEPASKFLQTGSRWTFRLGARPVHLRLRLVGMFNEPLANIECTLEVEGKSSKLKTDDDGNLDMEVPAKAEKAKLTHGDTAWEVRIGHLDPVEMKTGLRARLNNLGYWVGAADENPVDEEVMKQSIEFFQNDFGLAVTGEADAGTVQKLREAHGS